MKPLPFIYISPMTIFHCNGRVEFLQEIEWFSKPKLLLSGPYRKKNANPRSISQKCWKNYI